MFDIGYSELLVVAVVALIVIGPKDLPRVMRTVGHWVGRARGMARHFRSGIDTMIRESELEEMEKKWREENERIMREHPGAASWDDPVALPPADAASTNSDAVAADSGVGAAESDAAPAPIPLAGAEDYGPEPVARPDGAGDERAKPLDPASVMLPADIPPVPSVRPNDDGQLSLLPPDSPRPAAGRDGEDGASRRPLP